ncbi:LysR family transcriptional regulator [Streptomyces sp. NPDC059008]|uniref:LysR family transcriptional regulator n=1 Tax=Streptomyces sp. NPDC059008 TaxID=3346693 RepID=UPI0036A3F743
MPNPATIDNLRVMESREIEIFLTLAEELHFARTAERLLVSQARVSQTIKKLERRFGTALFERTSRRVALTPVGRRLRDDIGPAFVRIQEGIARATEAGRGVAGPLRVGFSGALQGDLVLSVQAALRSGNPECEVRLHEVPEGDPYGPLRSGEADLAIVRFPVDEPDLTAGPVLISDAVMLAVPARHRLARRDAVGEGDLAGESLLTGRLAPGDAGPGRRRPWCPSRPEPDSGVPDPPDDRLRPLSGRATRRVRCGVADSGGQRPHPRLRRRRRCPGAYGRRPHTGLWSLPGRRHRPRASVTAWRVVRRPRTRTVSWCSSGR